MYTQHLSISVDRFRGILRFLFWALSNKYAQFINKFSAFTTVSYVNKTRLTLHLHKHNQCYYICQIAEADELLCAIGIVEMGKNSYLVRP